MRIEEEAAFANLLVPSLLGRSGLADRDRAFVTELVYGTTRMRRACDWVVGQASHRPLDSLGTWVLNALRLGVYQLVFLGSAPHAAVSETVEVAPKSGRGLVNAVLRRVVREGTRSTVWPDDATRLSYPDWVVARLGDDLGRDAALGALEAMNQPAVVHRRADGYVQDPASQWVVGLVGASAGERVADVCAGPGGKATGAPTRRGWDWTPSRPSSRTAGCRRCGQGRSSVCSSTRPVPASACSAAVRTRAGGCGPATSPRWPGCSASC